jgi:uncharacterized protein YjbJ (UPF0337 family)
MRRPAGTDPSRVGVLATRYGHAAADGLIRQLTAAGGTTLTNERKDASMDNERIEGLSHQIKGAVKRAFGTMIGDAKTAADGAAEKASGEAQSAAAPTGGLVLGIDADRIKGVAHQLEGTLREGIGNLIADPGMQQAGIAEREAGKVQNAAGSARDSARETLHDTGAKGK